MPPLDLHCSASPERWLRIRVTFEKTLVRPQRMHFHMILDLVDPSSCAMSSVHDSKNSRDGPSFRPDMASGQRKFFLDHAIKRKEATVLIKFNAVELTISFFFDKFFLQLSKHLKRFTLVSSQTGRCEVLNVTDCQERHNYQLRLTANGRR